MFSDSEWSYGSFEPYGSNKRDTGGRHVWAFYVMYSAVVFRKNSVSCPYKHLSYSYTYILIIYAFVCYGRKKCLWIIGDNIRVTDRKIYLRSSRWHICYLYRGSSSVYMFSFSTDSTSMCAQTIFRAMDFLTAWVVEKGIESMTRKAKLVNTLVC